MIETYSRPNIVISKCLEHGNCRFDGGQISSPFIKKIEPYVNFFPICPEMEIGLGVPREAIKIIQNKEDESLVFSRSGHDVTSQMNEFSQKYIESISESQIDGFVLKSRSPSCGLKDVKLYKTYGKSPCIGKTQGFFGREIQKAYINFPIEDEGRLTNYNIRDHFLTQIFVLSCFRDVVKANEMKKLVEFHSNNKYLLMAYHQKNQKLLGKIVANHERKKTREVISAYEKTLRTALNNPLRRGRNMNMLMHLFGYFKTDLNNNEKAYFLEILEQYNTKRIPFRVPLSIIYSWVVRFDNPYLLNQSIFKPYPNEMIEVTDSGKGIE